MATIDKILTTESPSVLIGTTTIRFDKLFIRKGSIEELEFLISWKTTDGTKIISRCQTFNPNAFIDLHVIPSKVFYQLRITGKMPEVIIGQNTGVELRAFSYNDEAFELTVYIEIDPM